MKTKILFFVLFSYAIYAFSQIPTGYYDSAAGLNGEPLKIALHNIIDNHIVLDYAELHTHFESTDKKSNGKVWDIYSDNPGGTPPYQYSFISADQCGNYAGEGDCYNKEHSWPKSWYGGEVYPMYSDLFLLYPTDGFVNGKRSNYPYGEVSNSTWTSLNGSKLGPCTYPGYNQTVFEPIDEYKGDFARSYFYMSVRYYGEDSGWPGSDMTSGANLLTWAYNMMYDWHINDSVSQKEIDRNNAAYLIQNNRNPFIDHPEWVDSIWNPLNIKNIQLPNINLYPNPVKDYINIQSDCKVSKIKVFNKTGKLIFDKSYNTKIINIPSFNFSAGIYAFIIYTDIGILTKKIIILDN